MSGTPRLLLSWLHRPLPLLDFRVERRPKQHGRAGKPGPGHKADNRTKRAIEPVIVADMLEIPGDGSRAEQPCHGADRTTPAHPTPVWGSTARPIPVCECKRGRDRDQKDRPAQET